MTMELFVLLLAQLYPCGECSAHFKKLLVEKINEKNFKLAQKHEDVMVNNIFDFETKSSSVLWMCNLHNQVNQRLHKPQFDCAQAMTRWKCGCDEDE